ncbi:MAG: 3-deoxy-D-manno-octulosonic acid transferase [Lentisphaeria bacterium]|nr:3-deoxy-D-manno-octulosonic acid transferase [Lentisphaeria bacterium]
MFFQILIYNLLFPLFFILYFPFYLKKQLKRGGLDCSFWERFGFFSKLKKQTIRSLNEPVWIHAVSVGETVVALTFIEKWQKSRPELQFVLSTTTTTGQSIAQAKSNKNTTVIYMPFDFLCPLWRAFKLIKPSKLVIFEVEIWPNLMLIAKKKGVELSLVNGRMSDNSFRGFSRFSWFFQPTFALFDKIFVQTEADAERFNGVSGHRIVSTVCDTMKFDQAPSTASHLSREHIQSRLSSGVDVIFTAASTHPGEEEVILKAYKEARRQYQNLGLILVPRHVERTKEIESLISDENLSYSLLTQETDERKDLLLVNTTGELLSLIACSDLVYVGKSLGGNEGGHNIIEPAVFGKAILHGKNMQNFKVVTEIFQKEQASIVVTEETLAEEIYNLSISKTARENLGNKARSIVIKHSGAVAKTINLLESPIN